ncbi:MAG: hypothetical protein M4579_000910 [Chaenotheca gracillima]|nr:MAG: hypothetical protein M4579_000910 [Chaenotheca gracillima]
MPAPSPLSIATSSVLRLVKEEGSYHKELEQQEARLQRFQNGGSAEDENAEYQLKQEKRAIDETKAIFPQLRKRIEDGVGKLEQQLEAEQSAGSDSNVEEITKGKQAIADAKAALREIS